MNSTPKHLSNFSRNTKLNSTFLQLTCFLDYPQAIAPCLDTEEVCKSWASKYCNHPKSTYRDYMRRNCRSSCSLCQLLFRQIIVSSLVREHYIKYPTRLQHSTELFYKNYNKRNLEKQALQPNTKGKANNSYTACKESNIFLPWLTKM